MLLFIAQFARHQTRGRFDRVGVAINILLAVSGVALLIASWLLRRQDRQEQKHDLKFNRLVRNIIVVALAVIYFAASLAKLNGSSTALWRELADRQPPDPGLIAGRAKEIRSDEWFVHTPWIWSQAERTPAFPEQNTNIGDGVMPLLTNLPVRHWTMLFRPQMWGFFFLDRERAFAFNWNFKWFGLVLGGFLFLRIFARANNLLALSGAFILLFSSYIQWFFSSPTCMPEMISMVFFAVWAVHVMAKATSRWAIAGAGIVLVAAVEQFAFCCYPRFQIPLVYLALALLIGTSASSKNRYNVVGGRWDYFRRICLLAVLTAAAALLWQWTREVGPTITGIKALLYPGQTTSTGGGYHFLRFLAPFLEFSMTQEHYPAPLGNVCEASGFLFLAPVLVLAVAYDAWRRAADPILTALVVFLVLTFCYMTLGIPEWLARATGWSRAEPSRAIIAVGVASVVGVVRYLALPRDESAQSAIWHLIGALVVAPILFVCFYMANLQLKNFATLSEIMAASIFFAAVFALLWQRNQIASCVLLVISLLYTNGLVNPIGCGLPGLMQSPMLNWLSGVHKSDPHARWIVLGDSDNRNCCMAQFVRATGADVLGGTRCTPDREMLRVLDQDNHYANVYNRYARICVVVSQETEPAFELGGADNYQLRLPFQGDWFERLGVGYVLVVDRSDLANLPGFERVGEREGCVLFRRVSAR